MSESPHELLRQIPSVDVLMQSAEARWIGFGVPRRVLVDAVRAAVGAAREALQSEKAPAQDADALRESILDDIGWRIQAAVGPYYRKVVNATGIILHTALGRAVLPPRAMRQIQQELSGYSLVQADLETGRRSKRDERIEELLRQLTGAEAATVVNNNAAATAIVLNTVAAGREVIVSRGQLVEIGGSFRLPEVMAAAGAKLVEVGTTNKTHLSDYQRAITPETAAILRVHPSNYKILGFTSEVPLADLVRLGRDRGLTVIDDVGAGALIDFSRFGFQKEPTLPESVAAGADLITSSADKMIGGAQGGIILGAARWIQAIPDRPRGQADAGRAGSHAGPVSRRSLGARRSADAPDTLPRSGRAGCPGPADRRGGCLPGARRLGRGRGGVFANGERFAADAKPAHPPGGSAGGGA
jgi:L-seryl-tRNA(Ser) seleniumtransferase